MCMEVADYNANRTDVTAALKQLASGVSQKTIDDIDGIITWSGSGSIDMQLAMQHVKELNEFKHSVLNELESKFHTTFSKLSDLDKQVSTIKEHVNTLGQNQGVGNREVTAHIEELKGNVDILQRKQHERHEELGKHMQGLHTTAQLSHQDLTEIKENVNTLEKNQEVGNREVTAHIKELKGNVDILQRNQHERHEELGTQMQGLHTAAQLSHQDLTDIKEMLSELMVQQRSQRQEVQQDIDTTMHVDSDTPENATEAQEIIIITINDILKLIRPEIMEDRNSSEAIRHLVNELLTSDNCNYYGIIRELLQLIKDIGRYGTIQQARKGSITLTVRFTSFDGLLNFIQYVSSQTFQQRLGDLSKALDMVTGHAVTLSAHIAQESLYDLRKYLEKCEKIRRTKTVVLPVRCYSVGSITHIQNYLETNSHLGRMSEILTKIVGGKTTVTMHANCKRVEEKSSESEQMSPRFKEDDKEDNFGQSASRPEEDDKENDDASMLERESDLPPASQDNEEDKPEDEKEITPGNGNGSDKNEKDRLSVEKRKQCRIILDIPPNVRDITEDNIYSYDRFDTTKGLLSKFFQQFKTSGATDQHDKEDILKVLENSSQGKYVSKLDKTMRTPDLEKVRKPNQTEEDFYTLLRKWLKVSEFIECTSLRKTVAQITLMVPFFGTSI
ncbi:uncharacterized protein LOC123540317 isoform X2 [Mercenaria mercenaria]|uniref:uncharacterized protein LOC123540317 isoform X2 n=1 Tax=Mercenaria mercenaria TaxID=6596 RepID=UPI00234F13E0|nr:uncharacterized protein LOC123540317 isoform X2 [Mercenaria mercenaria]